MRLAKGIFGSLLLGSMVTNAFAAHKRLPPVGVVSDPTLHQVNITSHGATLGFSETGGGYANYLAIGDGKNLIAAAYGRGWQPSIRDLLHSGLYNPTQAGVSDQAGTPVHLSVRPSPAGPGQRMDIHPYAMALFLNPGFNFALPPWRQFPSGTKDTDGLHDDKVPLQDQLRSEFTFSGFFQDASGLADNTIPVFQFEYTMTYARDPGREQTWKRGMPYSAIYQFGPNATKTDGSPVLQLQARDYIGGEHFPARLATNTDLSRGLMDPGLRIVYSAGYHTVMWTDEQGQWQTGSLDDQKKIRFTFYSKGSQRRFGSFALLVKGNDPGHSPAIGLYIPQSSVINEYPIAGIDIKTGKQVYAEDRRTSWLMSTERIGPADPNEKSIRTYLVDNVSIENHFTILRPVLRYTGLLSPSHALPGVEERIRCEEFLLIGTPDEIRAAAEQIRTKLKTKQLQSFSKTE